MSENNERTLKELRDLMILQLRQSGVSPEAIGKVLGVTAKSIRNRYPIGKVKGESTEEGSEPSGGTS
ncbi:MAG: hypothetical protein JRM85_05090 [Nitrososphaerota archaeon]|nr:hypothetical protein [Nitrososphaerota archaeon]